MERPWVAKPNRTNQETTLTSHELARQLLAGPDKPVIIGVRCNRDAVWGDADDVTVTDEHEVNLVGFCSEGNFEWLEEDS